MRPDDELLTVREVSQILGVSRESIRLWLHAGRLGGVRIGHQFRVRRSDLDLFVRPAASSAA